jgi:hypothetical protein
MFLLYSPNHLSLVSFFLALLTFPRLYFDLFGFLDTFGAVVNALGISGGWSDD